MKSEESSKDQEFDVVLFRVYILRFFMRRSTYKFTRDPVMFNENKEGSLALPICKLLVSSPNLKLKLFLRPKVLGIHAIAPDKYVFLSRLTSSFVRYVQPKS